jgi:chromosome segregation ATPase
LESDFVTKKARNTEWLRQQAAQQRQAKADREARVTQQQQDTQTAKDQLGQLVTKLVTQQQRLVRLSTAFADRCWRVHELYQELKAEWERAEKAEARVQELETELAALKSTNGHAKKPAKAPAKRAPAAAGESP